jgi:O-antigen/teichoic acid export membrane protein
MAVLSMLSLPLGALGHLVTREVARYHHSEDWSLLRGLLRRSHQWIALCSTGLIVGLAVLSVPNMNAAPNDRPTLLLFGAPLLPLVGLNAVRRSTLRGLRHVFQAQLPELLALPSFHLLFAGVLLATGMLNPATALASQVGATASAFLFGTWLLRRRCPPQARTATPVFRNRAWARSIIPFTLLAGASTLNEQIGVLTLGWLATAEEVAALKVAQSGAVWVALPLTIVNLAIGPHVARLHREGDTERLQKLSRRSSRSAMLFSVPAVLLLTLSGRPLIRLVFGDAYATLADWPLAILALGQLVSVAVGSVGLFLAMTGYERDVLWGQVAALLVNAASALVLIPVMGAVGAALSTAIGIVTWNGVLAAKFVQRLHLRPSAF